MKWLTTIGEYFSISLRNSLIVGGAFHVSGILVCKILRDEMCFVDACESSLLA
jgi:hypothetical protein